MKCLMHSGHVVSQLWDSLTMPKFLTPACSFRRKTFRFPRAPSMKSSITFEFVNNPLCLLVASASIFDAITSQRQCGCHQHMHYCHPSSTLSLVASCPVPGPVPWF